MTQPILINRQSKSGVIGARRRIAMSQIITIELSSYWSANMVTGDQFVGVLKDETRKSRRAASSKEIFVDSGAITTVAGEAIGEPVGRPTFALGAFV